MADETVIGSGNAGSVDLDVLYGADEELEDVLAMMTAGTAVTTRVMEEHGPGGGWPLVNFTGPAEELVIVLGRYNQPQQ